MLKKIAFSLLLATAIAHGDHDHDHDHHHDHDHDHDHQHDHNHDHGDESEDTFSIEHLSTIFNSYDKDHNELLTEQQLFSAIRAEIGDDAEVYEQIQGTIRPLYQEFDDEKDGLDVDQFVAMAKKSAQQEEL